MTATLVASLSFSFALAAEGPYQCGLYKASGILSDARSLVVNAGKQGATMLRLSGPYQKNAKAGLAVEIEGEMKKEVVNGEGEIEVLKLKLIVPDPISNSGDELRLTQAKPCRDK